MLALPYYSARSKEYRRLKNRVRYNYINKLKSKVIWTEYNQTSKAKELRRNYYFKNKPIIQTKKAVRHRKYYYNNLNAIRLKHRQYYYKNKDYLRRYQKELRIKNKYDVIFHYTNGKMCCQACGYNVFAVLTIDHLFGNGSKHRRAINSISIWQWIKRNNYPKAYQVLCYNCNMLKEKTTVEEFKQITNNLRNNYLIKRGDAF